MTKERILELEVELNEEARLNGIGAERELQLLTRIRELEAERDWWKEIAINYNRDLKPWSYAALEDDDE